MSYIFPQWVLGNFFALECCKCIYKEAIKSKDKEVVDNIQVVLQILNVIVY